MILSWPLVAGAFLLKLVSTSSASITVSTFAGTGFMGNLDGPRDAATFDTPIGIAVDGSSNVYVAESENSRIRKITPDGTVSTLYVDMGRDIVIYHSSIAVDANGNVFTTNLFTNSIYMITPDGNASVFAGIDEPGYVDGPADLAQFRQPRGLAIDSDGNLIVADSMNRCIRKITPDGTVSTLAGGGLHGIYGRFGRQPQFIVPHDVVVDSFNNVYVAQEDSNRILKITPQGAISTFAEIPMSVQVEPDHQTRIHMPTDIAVDADGNVFVADLNNDRIRMVTADGTVSTIAGDGTVGFANGPGRFARFHYPMGIAIHPDGNLLVADTRNHCIRMITFSSENDNADALESYNTVAPRPILYNKDECAICYEVKDIEDEYDYCSTSCGNTFHKRCIDRCMRRRIQMQCPMCRSRWIIDKPSVAIPTASAEDEE